MAQMPSGVLNRPMGSSLEDWEMWDAEARDEALSLGPLELGLLEYSERVGATASITHLSYSSDRSVLVTNLGFIELMPGTNEDRLAKFALTPAPHWGVEWEPGDVYGQIFDTELNLDEEARVIRRAIRTLNHKFRSQFGQRLFVGGRAFRLNPDLQIHT